MSSSILVDDDVAVFEPPQGTIHNHSYSAVLPVVCRPEIYVFPNLVCFQYPVPNVCSVRLSVE